MKVNKYYISEVQLRIIRDGLRPLDIPNDFDGMRANQVLHHVWNHQKDGEVDIP